MSDHESTPEPGGRSSSGNRWRPDRLGPRTRTGLAAGAAALAVGGLGGFALGHATADGAMHHETFDGQRLGGQRLGGGSGDHDGFRPPGQVPGQPRPDRPQPGPRPGTNS